MIYADNAGNENLGPLKNGILGEAEAPGPASNEPRIPLILAENRTKRPDILRRFKTYDGGWNISNEHYWAVSGFICSFPTGFRSADDPKCL